MEKNELINRINRVFGKEKYPVCRETSETFGGKPWNELDYQFLTDNSDSIYYLSREEFKYYLPAFLIAIVDKMFETNPLADIVINKLTLPAEIDALVLAEFMERAELTEHFSEAAFRRVLQAHQDWNSENIRHFIECMTAFNREQCLTIRYFLEYMEPHSVRLYYKPGAALQRYWFQFSEDMGEVPDVSSLPDISDTTDIAYI